MYNVIHLQLYYHFSLYVLYVIYMYVFNKKKKNCFYQVLEFNTFVYVIDSMSL